MIVEFFLVLPNASFEFVDKAIDRSIHIFFSVITIDGAAVDTGSRFSFVA